MPDTRIIDKTMTSPGQTQLNPWESLFAVKVREQRRPSTFLPASPRSLRVSLNPAKKTHQSQPGQGNRIANLHLVAKNALL